MRRMNDEAEKAVAFMDEIDAQPVLRLDGASENPAGRPEETPARRPWADFTRTAPVVVLEARDQDDEEGEEEEEEDEDFFDDEEEEEDDLDDDLEDDDFEEEEFEDEEEEDEEDADEDL